MDITAFIRELLFSHDCVVVPGFGGFIGNYSPARIDKTTSTFFPPVKQISFNRNLSHNDGLLIGKVSEFTKLNYGDARNIIEEFVAGIRRKLEKGEKVVFDNIGSFINNHEGNVQFEPDRTVNYHLDSYGLESFQFQPLEGYNVRTRLNRHLDKDPVKHESTRKILWRAAVIIPLIGILASIPFVTSHFRTKVESTTLNPLASAEFENNRKAVDEKVKNSVTEGQINPAGEETKTAVIIPDSREAVSYRLITGSFRIKNNAESQAELLRKQGFDPEIIQTSNGFYRVSAAMCSNLDTAIEKKESITRKFPDTWISK